MPNWRFHQNPEKEIDRDTALNFLVSTYPDLQARWDKYKTSTYENYEKKRLDYIDVIEIILFILEKINHGNTNDLDKFFSRIEILLEKGDDYTKGLVTIGILEGLQNMCDSNYDYYHGFDKWLKPKTKKAWMEIIDSWEKDRSQ